MLDRGARPRRGVRRHLPRPRRRSSTRRSWPRRCRSSAAIHDLAGPRRLLRDAELLARHGRSRARRAHAEGAASSARRSRPSSSSSTSSGTSCRTSGPDELLADPELGFCRPPPAQPPPLPAPPALRARGARAHRDERDRRLGLPAPVHGADLGARGAAARPRRAGLARGGPVAPPGPRPRAPPRGRRGGHRRAAPRPAHARVRLQHAAPGQGDEGPAARLSALARLAQPGERGERRVGRGADRGGAGPLRPRAALVRAEGAPARARPARLLRPDGAGVGLRRPHPVRRGRGDRARLLPHLLAGAGRHGRGVLHRRLHGRPAAARQARRRVLLVHGAVGAPVRDAQLHLAPARRAHDGPRARPRRARGARAAAGHLPLHHPADARRDRVDLRREHRARAPARARARAPPSGSTCSPARSTARWPRCSARSR